MTSDFPDTLFEFEPGLRDRLSLPPEAVSRAIALSQTISEHSWSAYLTLLALEGFTAWFDQRSPPIALHRQKATLLEGNIAAITRVLLNQFRVCLVVMDEDAETVELPAAVIDRPSQRSHFYVAIVVHEELQQVSMGAFLRSDHLNQYCQQTHLRPVNQTYSLPISCFESDFDQILLYATALDPNALPLPAIQLSIARSQVKQRFIQPVVTASTWLQEQMNTLREAAWTFVSPGAPSMAVRSISEPFTLLQRLGQLPPGTKVAYQDVILGDRTSRLYAAIGFLEASSEWSLLIALQLPPLMPDAIEIAIYSGETRVAGSTQPSESMLSVQAIAAQRESLTVVIRASRDSDATDTLTLPPFQFQASANPEDDA